MQPGPSMPKVAFKTMTASDRSSKTVDCRTVDLTASEHCAQDEWTITLYVITYLSYEVFMHTNISRRRQAIRGSAVGPVMDIHLWIPQTHQ